MFLSYLKLALKVLLRRKFYTAISLFGIALTMVVLGIGTAAFDQLFFSGYPEEKLGRMLGIHRAVAKGEDMEIWSPPGFALLDRYARDLPGVEQLSIVTRAEAVASYQSGVKRTIELRRTDGAFWELMDFEFLRGGPYTAVDDAAGNFVAVINEKLERELFPGEDALGRSVTTSGQTFTIVGVVRDVSRARRFSFAEMWAPHGTAKTDEYKSALMGGFAGILLLERGTRTRGVKDAFRERLAAAELSEHPGIDTVTSQALTAFEMVAHSQFGGDDPGEAPRSLLVLELIAGALLVMALPALNLVNLNLSRILERSPEIGVRRAFGATSRTLVGQFLSENLVLTMFGGVLGIAAVELLLVAANGSGLFPYSELHVNYRVIGTGLVFTFVFGVLSGSYPAWRMSRLNPVAALRRRV